MATVDTEQLKGKNWVATMVLAWCFGMLGGHRFYTGKTGTAWAIAILYLLGAVTCGITSIVALIWGVVDAVMIALGKWTHEDGSELYEMIPWLGYVYIACLVLCIIGILVYILFGAAIVGSALSTPSGAGY